VPATNTSVKFGVGEKTGQGDQRKRNSRNTCKYQLGYRRGGQMICEEAGMKTLKQKKNCTQDIVGKGKREERMLQPTL